jgi:glycosyltransferase involved in cell wall biosynthesis
LFIENAGITKNNKRPVILYVITQGVLGGAQNHVFHLATGLQDKIEAHVAFGVQGPLGEKLKEKGIGVYHLPSLTRPVSPLKDARCLRELINLIKKIKPDLITTHSSKAGITGRLAARLTGVPATFTAHGWAFTEGVVGTKKKLYVWAEQIAARWAKKIICVSEYDRQLALRLKVGRTAQLITIHNGIPEIAAKYFAQPGISKKVRLIMVARFSPPKDYKLLLEALSRMKGSAWEALFVGDGPHLNWSKEYAQKLGLTEKVKFLGSCPDVAGLLAKAHIFVLTSNWEGFPLTILEAMRAGLPVVASDVGGVKESIVDEQTGFLVPRGNAEVLKERLQILIDNPDLRVQMGQRGQERFKNNFTLAPMLERTWRVYQEILTLQETVEKVQIPLPLTPSLKGRGLEGGSIKGFFDSLSKSRKK